jgi:transposase
MGSINAEALSSVLLLPDHIAVEAVYPTKTHLTVQVVCTLKSAACPLCQHSSERIHASYGRTVADVPCGGRRVTLALTVRKFVCRTPDCPRKIFTERLPVLVQSYARMTNRLSETLQTLGFATCGELGERFAPKLGMQVSGPTLLRLMRTRSYTPPASVSILGIDDGAWKKGTTYGTILVDLQSRKPIELLPDRTAETAEAWLRTHPEVELVSRDRGGDYAAAARKGAPQAQQVADKFHLLKNLRERLKDLMDRRHACLPAMEDKEADAIPAKAQGIRGAPVPEPTENHSQVVQQRAEPQTEPASEKHYRTIPPTPYQRPAGISYHELQKQGRRAKRSARYEDVRTLSKQGVGIRAIARRLKLSRQTVRRFMQAEEFPEIVPAHRDQRGSILNQYKPYIFQRWQQGCKNSVQIYDEMKARGYPGSASLLRNFLARLRKKHAEAGSAEVLTFNASTDAIEIPVDLPPKPRVTRRMSSTRASWLFVSQLEKLDEKQRNYIEQIRQGHPDLEMAYQLGQGFVMMLAERRNTDLDSWLTQAEHSGLPEFKKMAKGIRLDYVAVKAAFSSEWSNGQVEAQVNCLKLQKRVVFGRANFDLLRLRVLCRV